MNIINVGISLHKEPNNKTAQKAIYIVVATIIISGAYFSSSKAAISTNGLSLYGTSITAGTVEATKFCTGDGETNCVTDFSAIDTDTTLNESTVEGYIENDINTNYVPRNNGSKLVTGSISDDGTNIGIDQGTALAKLHVNGDILIGNSSATCNSSTEGSQRYNSSTKYMEYCNGTSWASYSSSSSSIGSVTCFAQTILPSGYLETNGQAVSRTTYSSLFSTISTNYGTGDGSTTFNLPNKINPFMAENAGHRYYRWYITSKTPTGSEGFVEVAEVHFKVNGQWRGNKSGSVGPWSVSTNSSSCYSSESPCSSGTSNAFTHADLLNGSYPEYFATKSNAFSTSGTYAGSEWIEFDFGSAVAITGFSITAKDADNTPGTWYLAYSDDDVTYTMIEESEVPDNSGTGFSNGPNIRFTYEWDGNYGICGIKY